MGRYRRRKNFWLRCRILIFSFCIKRLQHFYRQYAYYDGINLDAVKMIQSCRDEEFEDWLKAIGQDIRPHLSSNIHPFEENHSRLCLRPFYKFFHFKRQLLVYHSGKELVIDRSSHLTIDNEIKGAFKISDDTDILLRTEFKGVVSMQNVTEEIKTQEDIPSPQPHIENPPKQRTKVSLGKFGTNKTPPYNEPPAKEKKSKVLRGVIVDESF